VRNSCAFQPSRTGVTGEQVALSDALGPLVKAVRESTNLPLAAGFGISTPEQASAVARIADGVVVGSAFVRIIEQGQSADSIEQRLEAFARELRGGMDR
jgi:tryptophan synthase alpha chain